MKHFIHEFTYFMNKVIDQSIVEKILADDFDHSSISNWGSNKMGESEVQLKTVI